MPRPTFVVIGSQRCGTTHLHRCLEAHPGITTPLAGRDLFDKEIHYFDKLIADHDLEWYERQFPETSQPVRGEITPGYCTLSTGVVRQIARYAPDLRIVLMIRHPVDRIWSQLKMRHHQGWGGAPRDSVVAARPLQYLVAEAERRYVRRLTDYGSIIRTWTNAFGADALEVVLFDEFVDQTTSTLSRVYGHVGADTGFTPPTEVLTTPTWSSPAGDPPDELAEYLADRWLAPTVRLDQMLDGRVAHWVADLERRRGVAMRRPAPLRHRVSSTPRRLGREVKRAGIDRHRALVARRRVDAHLQRREETS